MLMYPQYRLLMNHSGLPHSQLSTCELVHIAPCCCQVPTWLKAYAHLQLHFKLLLSSKLRTWLAWQYSLLPVAPSLTHSCVLSGLEIHCTSQPQICCNWSDKKIDACSVTLLCHSPKLSRTLWACLSKASLSCGQSYLPATLRVGSSSRSGTLHAIS